MLTTITPYWGRSDALVPWIVSLKAASRPWIKHIIIFVGENPPGYWGGFTDNTNITTHLRTEKPEMSIGFYHNLGARYANSEWIMKLDIDVIPHLTFFDALEDQLRFAKPLDWFCCGMFHLNQAATRMYATPPNLPLAGDVYLRLCQDIRTISEQHMKGLPIGTQWICRRQEYLAFGGADQRFRHYGWEDYQQIYMLERARLGRDPLAGPVTLLNVTQRCRDEISRFKAAELFKLDNRLALIHRYHPKITGGNSKYMSSVAANKKILYDYIQQARSDDGQRLFDEAETSRMVG
jgi:hypothetical protein